jgi:hypothetical protein
MKHLLICLLVLFGFLQGRSQYAFQPSEKVLAAYSSADLQSMTSDEIITLNVIGDKLCVFKPMKDQTPSESYQMKLRNGKSVVLSDADVANFNPLLYSLPGQDKVCENLVIQTKEGNFYMLVVKSQEIIDIEKKKCYVQMKHNKEAKK